MVTESFFADFNTVDNSDLIKDELMDLRSKKKKWHIITVETNFN